MVRECGIVGLPNVGKSTLFKILSKKYDVLSENYPFCTIEPNVGVAIAKDARLDKLADIFSSKKKIYQTVSFVDIAGLVDGAASGAGLGNKFLSTIRSVKAILHVVRCFDDEEVIHVCENVDPERDVRIIENELVLADIQNIENILNKMKKKIYTCKEAKHDHTVLSSFKKKLEEGVEDSSDLETEQGQDTINKYMFLTVKPVLFVANISDCKLSDDNYKESTRNKILSASIHKNAKVLFVSSKLELEIDQMDADEQIEFLQEYGLEELCLTTIIRESMHAVGYHTFFTAGPKEARAWELRIGATAVDAASEIHTDIGKKFVRAEVVSLEDMESYRSLSSCRSNGVLRIEGPKYIIKNGDIINVLAST
ncbi:MAG: redox-regulated ATPase YchF [Chlamydiia bacterium]|nr:redox-regulated ATPase YchF [Chlamydiia bacterium]